MSTAAQPHGYINAKPTDGDFYLPNLVWQYRRNETALRRLRAHYCFNAGATEDAILRREHDRRLAENSLAAFGDDTERTVIHWLIVERDLLDHIAEAKSNGAHRPPELYQPLAEARFGIRKLLLTR